MPHRQSAPTSAYTDLRNHIVPLLEVCSDSVEHAQGVACKADRIEFCGRLDLGGTTPALSDLRLVLESCALPVHAMIRPRGGDFVYTEEHLAQMELAIRGALDCGVHGLVFGVLDQEQCIDARAMDRLLEAAQGTPVSFHRAFDGIEDKLPALELLIDLGVARLLTAGGPGSAWQGRDHLRELVEVAGKRLVVMPGGGIRQDHVKELIDCTGAREVHSSVVLQL